MLFFSTTLVCLINLCSFFFWMEFACLINFFFSMNISLLVHSLLLKHARLFDEVLLFNQLCFLNRISFLDHFLLLLHALFSLFSEPFYSGVVAPPPAAMVMVPSPFLSASPLSCFDFFLAAAISWPQPEKAASLSIPSRCLDPPSAHVGPTSGVSIRNECRGARMKGPNLCNQCAPPLPAFQQQLLTPLLLAVLNSWRGQPIMRED